MKAELALQFKAEVGEGPIWDSATQELIFIDVTQGLIHRFNPKYSSLSTIEIGTHIGAVGLMDQFFYIGAIRDGFATINRQSGEISYLSKVLDDLDTRFNDGKCDPFGNFVAGTMRYEPEMGTAALYSLVPNGNVKRLLEGIGLSNGLCWDSSGTTLFYIDTLTRQIAKFDYDPTLGIIGNRKVLYEFSPSSGSPDGMTIDLEGNLWVALWGGSRIVQINSNGQLTCEIPLPVSQPTSVGFGGKDMNQLFITSACYHLNEVNLKKEPHAGSVFVVEVGIPGREEFRFSLTR